MGIRVLEMVKWIMLSRSGSFDMQAASAPIRDNVKAGYVVTADEGFPAKVKRADHNRALVIIETVIVHSTSASIIRLSCGKDIRCQGKFRCQNGRKGRSSTNDAPRRVCSNVNADVCPRIRRFFYMVLARPSMRIKPCPQCKIRTMSLFASTTSASVEAM